MVPLEADFAALLSDLADGADPLDRIGEWVDAHEPALERGEASAELRVLIREALALCWNRRRRHVTDAAARASLRALARRLVAARTA